MRDVMLLRADGGLTEVDSAAEAVRLGWDRLVGPDDLFLGARWLEVAERTAGAPMRYLLRGGPDGPVAALATALATESSPWVLGRPDTLLGFSADDDRPGARDLLDRLGTSAGPRLLPSLVCGGRHMGRSRVLRDPGLTAGEATGLITELVSRAERFAAESGARSVAFPFVDEPDDLLREVLSARGYLSHQSGRYSRLPLASDGFEGLLARLSPKRRRRVLAERRHVAAAGVTVGIGPLDPALIPRLGVLEEELMHKYGLTWTAAQTEATLREMLDVFGDELQICTAVGDGEVRGFGTLLRHQGQWYARQAGFDYAWQGALPLYFEVLYYRPAELAPSHGITGIHYGMGSEEAKRSRGCLAADQNAFLLPLAPAGAGA
ncbi:GNAT family N-acetyltransferase [Micromonospora sp. ALFpr18c]|uniref:GNAT family N-acetyltransferase n=1 Tax=Micromonospora sp. ALFpr18c TaxID=1458665 RepID=UPI00124B1B4A|nr:GNAT family N-acetyltransferase [Micromonospora sp. ALFpr18c]KAB1935301.1 GNAT family N-acetyltransferase [Micromonospora sp. ALFpr18c]